MGYLARSVYPYPLVFDYGDYLTPVSAGAMLDALLVAGLLGAMLVALRIRPLVGFAGVLFFAVLAPTSSVVPVATQTIADHRMYLPLAVVLAALALAAFAWLGRRAWMLAVAAALVAGGLTFARNGDYASAVSLWRKTVQQRPENLRARNNLAASLLEAHETEAGLAELAAALKLKPDHPDLLRNLAQAELDAGQTAQALAHITQAQQIDPTSAAGWQLLGSARLQLGEAGPAAEAYGEARRRRPDSPAAAYGLAVALFQAGRLEEAIAVFAELRRREPDFPGLHLNYGGALLDAGAAREALAEFDAALAREQPTAELLYLRSLALLKLERRAEAEAAARATLKLAPGYVPALELARELGISVQ